MRISSRHGERGGQASEDYEVRYWQIEAKLSFNVQVTCSQTLVYVMPARNKHECAWRSPSITEYEKAKRDVGNCHSLACAVCHPPLIIGMDHPRCRSVPKEIIVAS